MGEEEKATNPVLTRYNGLGCAFGQILKTEVAEDFARQEKTMEKLEKRVAQVTWALVGAAITFATMTLALIFTQLVP